MPKDLNKNNRRWRKQVNVNTKRMKQLMQMVRADVVRRTQNSKDLEEWLENLAPYVAANCFKTGIHATEAMDIINQISDVVYQTSLPSGSNAEILKGVMAEACYTMVTNVGEDLKTEMQKIAVESYNQRNTPRETAKLLEQRIDVLDKTRARVIARTETCRAANLGNYLNAKQMGAKSYSVICNEGACEYCIAEYGENQDTKYDINDTDNMPPFHPNCRCTPVWSMEPIEK